MPHRLLNLAGPHPRTAHELRADAPGSAAVPGCGFAHRPRCAVLGWGPTHVAAGTPPPPAGEDACATSQASRLQSGAVRACARWAFLMLLATIGFICSAQDERPVVEASKVTVEKAAANDLPTFHIVGDSTVRSGGTGAGLWGWGERITPFFDTQKINVVNHAIGGRSARTYCTEGRWDKVASSIRRGDFVIIQFGHNDGGRIGDPAVKNRADGPGLGDETVEDTKPDGTKELVHTFGWYMARFVTDAQSRGATVILCSPIPHKQRWETGRDFASFAKWDEAVARAHSALFFDLTMVITDAYKKAGREQVNGFFADKGTHTTDAGAQFNAACVIAGLKSLKDNPLGAYFSAKGLAVQPYVPAAPVSPN